MMASMVRRFEMGRFASICRTSSRIAAMTSVVLPSVRATTHLEWAVRIGDNADHFIRFAIQCDRAAYHLRIPAKFPLPEPAADDHYTIQRSVFLGAKIASENRCQAPHFEVRRRDTSCEKSHRFAGARKVCSKGDLRGHVLKNSLPCSPIGEVRRGHRVV